jgi:hypothetical protein
MNEDDFEGTLVLEQMAAIGERDAFFDAIDSDDFQAARALMEKACIDEATIKIVLRKMHQADGEH